MEISQNFVAFAEYMNFNGEGETKNHAAAPILVKFIYSEKATKFCEIFTLLLSYVVPVKNKVDISQNFVAFSEYMNFNTANRNVHLIAGSNSRLTYLPKCLQSSHKTIITIVCRQSSLINV